MFERGWDTQLSWERKCKLARMLAREDDYEKLVSRELDVIMVGEKDGKAEKERGARLYMKSIRSNEDKRGGLSIFFFARPETEPKEVLSTRSGIASTLTRHYRLILMQASKTFSSSLHCFQTVPCRDPHSCVLGPGGISGGNSRWKKDTVLRCTSAQ